MELLIPTISKAIKLGDSFNEVKEQLSCLHLELDIDDSSAPVRQSLTSEKLGFSLSFRDQSLSNIFLYIDKKDFASFSGKISYLDDAFWVESNDENFRSALTKSGFSEWSKKYPHAIDMVTDTIRIRLTTRPDTKMISIDDGSFIRNLAKKSHATVKAIEAIPAIDGPSAPEQKSKSRLTNIVPNWLRKTRVEPTVYVPIEGNGIALNLGELKKTTLQKLAPLGASVLYLEDGNSISLKEHGVHLGFHLNKLIVFDLYISNSDFKPFRGSCAYLKSTFWGNPTATNFTDHLHQKKFSLSAFPREGCLDMIKNDINVRHYHNNKSDLSIRIIQQNKNS